MQPFHKLPIKIQWRTDLTKDLSDLFYPSVLKKLKSALPQFSEHFELRELPLDQHVFFDVFVPLYDKEIASRSDYRVDRNKLFESISSQITSGKPLFLYALFEKSSGRFSGGVLYALRGDHVAIVFRAFDSQILERYHYKISIDYIIEAEFFKHIKKYELPFLTHGKDRHPYRSNIGLSLFKMKVGSKPHVPPTDIETVDFDIEQMKTREKSFLFFDNPQLDGFYTGAYLFYKKTDVFESFIHEFEVVFEWAGLKLNKFES